MVWIGNYANLNIVRGGEGGRATTMCVDTSFFSLSRKKLEDKGRLGKDVLFKSGMTFYQN